MNQEAILLDLLRVISHHRARLATPIRTVQKMYSDTDLENIPFADTIYNRGAASNRPLLLIEPSYKINGEDKAKSQTRSGRVAGEQDSKSTQRSTPDTKAGASSKSDSRIKETPKSDTKADARIGETSTSHTKEHTKAATASTSDPGAVDKVTGQSSPISVPKTNSTAVETSSSGSKAASSVSDSLNKNNKISDSKQSKSTSPGNVRQNSKFDNPAVSSSEAGNDNVGGLQESSQSKHERKSVSQPSMSRPGLGENIVLGVALEGSKRTLPIEEGMASNPSPAEVKEVASACRNGIGSPAAEKERKDGQLPTSPSATSCDL